MSTLSASSSQRPLTVTNRPTQPTAAPTPATTGNQGCGEVVGDAVEGVPSGSRSSAGARSCTDTAGDSTGALPSENRHPPTTLRETASMTTDASETSPGDVVIIGAGPAGL